MNRATFDAMLAQYTTPTVTGEGAVSWDKGAHCVIPEVQISGKCVQDGTPTPDAPIMPVFSDGTTVECSGSIAVAPRLLAVSDAYCDTWNPQTGKGQHRFYKITLDGVTGRKKFRSVHNVEAADVFCVSMENIHGDQNITPHALASAFAVVCNYFPFEMGYYANRIGAFNHGNPYYGLDAKFPYSLFGISKGEKTNNELVDLVNAWCSEKYEAGVPLYYYYVMEKPEEFRVAPQPLIQPHGAGNIIQIGGTVDNCPIIARPVTHR